MNATQIHSGLCMCSKEKTQKKVQIQSGAMPRMGLLPLAIEVDNTRRKWTRSGTDRSSSNYSPIPMLMVHGCGGSNMRRAVNKAALPAGDGIPISTNINTTCIPIMVNGCTGKMGEAVMKAALSAGLDILPVAFGSANRSGQTVQVCGIDIKLYGPSESKSLLQSIFSQHPQTIVVDCTVPAAVNDNADLYCQVGVPFVMGTTGGDRERLYKTVDDSKVYAVISPQMGKQVVAFVAAMEILAKEFPGAFSGYSLQVIESHQAGKLDTSGTAKAVISCLQKLGASFDMDQIQAIRDPKQQIEMGVPEEHLSGHAFHMYRLTSPDGKNSFEFQHNVCGRSIYAEGTVDAILFLAKKVQLRAEKRIYNLIDVLREGWMR